MISARQESSFRPDRHWGTIAKVLRMATSPFSPLLDEWETSAVLDAEFADKPLCRFADVLPGVSARKTLALT